MKIQFPFTQEELFTFIKKAGRSTYAATSVESAEPDTSGFKKLVYEEGDFSYSDTYTGFYRSRGMELVRYKGVPVWSQLYGGGMKEGGKDFALETFTFLKKAFKLEEKKFPSFRGPKYLKENEWEYRYKQEGDVYEFQGYEEILYKGKVVFYHHTIGGIILKK